MATMANFIFSLILSLANPAYALNGNAGAYDVNVSPLDELSRELLSGNGYELRTDGLVWDKISETPVRRSDMPYLLSRLASAKRLGALLKLNNIINRYDAERKLTPEDKEAVRAIVRQNWVVFGSATRRDFHSYFSAEERESLDKISPRFESMSQMAMADPAPESPTASAPIPPPSVPPPPIPTPAVSTPVVTSIAPTLTTSTAPKLGVLLPWTPPAPSTETIVSSSSPVAPVAEMMVATVTVPPIPVVEAAPQPTPVRILDVSAAEFDKFVDSGPYSKSTKSLLEILGKRAPDFCLPLLRRTVVSLAPQVVIDGARTGFQLRAGFIFDPSQPMSPPIIALSPGPVLLNNKSQLFGSSQPVLLNESTSTWSALAIATPTKSICSRSSPASS
jgi:hypothetical protein